MALGVSGVAGNNALGFASGRIRIDTSDVTRGAAAVRTAAQDTEQSFARMGTAAGRAQTNVVTLGRSLQSVQGYMSGGVSAQAATNIAAIAPAAKTSGASLLSLGGSLASFASTFGIVFGAASIAQLGRFVLASDEMATAYARQSVAAVNLAGSQANLNSLMVAYDKATGGAVDEATALADVTRLQAVGFADSAEELTRFVTASRGISLAMGQQQDYVISQLQLAIANQSTMRLDQIGLGVSEVKQRIDELRASNSSLTTEMAYQEAVLSIAEEKYGALAESAEAQATGAERAKKEWKDLRLAIGQMVDGSVGEGMNKLADNIDSVAFALESATEWAEQLGDRFSVLERYSGYFMLMQKTMGAFFNPVGSLGGTAFDLLGAYQSRSEDYQARLGVRSSLGVMTREGVIGGSDATFGGGYSDDQTAAIRQWADNVKEIEREAASQRLEATRQYESQRSEAIASYEKTIAREAEDFARQRLRAEQQLADDIADVRADLADQEREWQADYVETVAEIRGDANARLAEIEEDYAREQEQRERQHRNNLLSAAGTLDAQAILAEKRRYEEEQQAADESYQEQVSDVQEGLNEQLEAARESHEEQLRLARETAEERIADLQESFEEERRIEDEDRAIRLQRQAEDHREQLAELDRTQAERLAQIDQQAAEQRQALDDSFRAELDELGMHKQSWLVLQQQQQQESLDLFEEYWNGVKRLTPSPRAEGLREYQTGGRVGSTGPAYLHAGEYVLNPQITRALDSMMGGMSQQRLLGAMAGTTRNSSMTVAPGAIQINAAGMDPAVIETAVEQALVNTLKAVA